MIKERDLNRATRLVSLPFWYEAWMGVEYIGLKTSRVYYGCGVPRGDGSPVLTVPGFLASDFYLFELRRWLRRIGYSPVRSRIGVNAECPDLVARRLLKRVTEVYDRQRRRVHLIGHSLGGVLARGVACQAPGKIASVITLASPIQGANINSLVGRALACVRARASARGECSHDECFSLTCRCDLGIKLHGKFPARVRQTAIYTRDDGIIDWHDCITGDSKTDFEAKGTHIGMAWNADVYRIIAQRLALATSRA